MWLLLRHVEAATLVLKYFNEGFCPGNVAHVWAGHLLIKSHEDAFTIGPAESI